MNRINRNRLKLALLVVVTFGCLLLVVDVCRAPAHQLTARSYIGLVHVYQAVGRPLLKGVVACRYRPTCSDYSIEAVQKHGTLRGLVLTYKRLRSCTDAVPMGTNDPVPN